MALLLLLGRTNHNDNGYSGHVRVYEWDNTSWTQLGDDIDGENFADFSGWSVSLSSDGTIVAIGSSNDEMVIILVMSECTSGIIVPGLS